ncbi:hypothetical protein ACFVT5_22830 [Streptomyces sp. NPDC058001]|uniref:hypothetical protein n=1 Tax=Streptomyces sp. NPDC058001 TaxID=3346300 RepID=UPI0036EE48D5
MRLSHGFVPMLAVLVLLTALPYESSRHESDNDPETARPARVRDAAASSAATAECRTTVTGSEAVTYCHNPYPQTDRVALHIDCAQWWDVDSDGAPVDAGPATTVRLAGRCWKEIRSVWISHEKV